MRNPFSNFEQQLYERVNSFTKKEPLMSIGAGLAIPGVAIEIGGEMAYHLTNNVNWLYFSQGGGYIATAGATAFAIRAFLSLRSLIRNR